jgi:hypothetical protein
MSSDFPSEVEPISDIIHPVESVPAVRDEPEENKLVTNPNNSLVVFNRFATRIYRESPLYALITLNTTIAMMSVLWSFILRASKNINKTIRSEVYVFFENNNTPYHTSDFKTSGAGVSPVAWYYNLVTRNFCMPNVSDYDKVTHRLSFLSAEITYGELRLYDITDFIGNVTYSTGLRNVAPTPEQIVAAWALETGVVVSRSGSIKLSVITDDGDSKTLSLYDGN